ncbi:MAG: HlyC/CorC family transporter [Lachnospiraceae bacterium]|nr:HlyC/CorC family transporter [Lachnospiraceae bacterium]
MGIFKKKKSSEEDVTEEDLILAINEGHEQGVLKKSQAEMINNIFLLDDKEAGDIMTHRTEIVSIDGDLSLEDVAKKVLSLNKSRFPVYVDDLDNIIGIVTFRDVMIRQNQGLENSEKIKNIQWLIRPAVFVPETKKINVLFRDMQQWKNHMVIVADEYGQTSGIVCMEDILEEIVGNIFDEYDDEDADIIKKEDGTYVIKGDTPLEDIKETLHIEFDEDCETLNGYLTAKLDRVLQKNERPEMVVNNVKYKILGVKNRVITNVLVTILKVNDQNTIE